MTPDAGVLRFPSAVGGMGAEDYGRFTRELSPDELAGCFFFTDDDRRRIATRRGRSSRLGFAVQLGTVRYLGRFLENPADIPRSVIAWTSREIGVAPGASLEVYGEGEARWEHQAEIRRAYGYRPFGDHGVEDDLALWLRARAWVSAESHRVLFARAAEHLIARRGALAPRLPASGPARGWAGACVFADHPTRVRVPLPSRRDRARDARPRRTLPTTTRPVKQPTVHAGVPQNPACYRASWQLPGRDSHPQATTSLRWSRTTSRPPTPG